MRIDCAVHVHAALPACCVTILCRIHSIQGLAECRARVWRYPSHATIRLQSLAHFRCLDKNYFASQLFARSSFISAVAICRKSCGGAFGEAPHGMMRGYGMASQHQRIDLQNNSATIRNNRNRFHFVIVIHHPNAGARSELRRHLHHHCIVLQGSPLIGRGILRQSWYFGSFKYRSPVLRKGACKRGAGPTNDLSSQIASSTRLDKKKKKYNYLWCHKMLSQSYLTLDAYTWWRR